jgi:hypothetical protein
MLLQRFLSETDDTDTDKKPPIVYHYALRCSLHLMLIGLFESIFVWSFISPAEDAALISIVNGYTQGLLNMCAVLTNQERLVVREIVGDFVNQTRVDTIGIHAYASRSEWNTMLVRRSWFYVGGLGGICFLLVLFGRKYKTQWRTLILEDITLVSLLGLYEWMFFSTVVLRYQAISMPELNRMVVDEVNAQC